MKPLTLKQKRFVAGIWLVVFLSALGNEYFEWGIFGSSAKLTRSIVMFVGLLAVAKFGPKMVEEMYAYNAAKLEAAKEAEREIDKSVIAAETDELRRSLGMTLDAAEETAAQQSAPEDALKQRASER